MICRPRRPSIGRPKSSSTRAMPCRRLANHPRGLQVPFPSTYVVAGEDHAIPLQYQDMFAAAAGAEVVEKIQSGHSPQLSKPDELVDLIEEAAVAAGGSGGGIGDGWCSKQWLWLNGMVRW